MQYNAKFLKLWCLVDEQVRAPEPIRSYRLDYGLRRMISAWIVCWRGSQISDKSTGAGTYHVVYDLWAWCENSVNCNPGI